MLRRARSKVVLLAAIAAIVVVSGLFAAAVPATAEADLTEELARALVDGTGDEVKDPWQAARVSAVIVALLPAVELEQRLWNDPERIPDLYRTLATGLVHGGLDEPSDIALLDYLMSVAEQRVRRLSVDPAPADRDARLDLLVAMLEIDPVRFRADPAFRRRVAGQWNPVGGAWFQTESLRHDLLRRANRGAESDFDLVETVGVALGLVRRSTAERQRPEVLLRATTADDELAPIEASFFSAPSFIGSGEMASLLAAVRRSAPHRQLLVLASSPAGRSLRSRLSSLDVDGVTILPALGIEYSPWLRDPMSWVRRADGGLHAVLRGNVQPGREADQWAGRALIQGLPGDLDERWGRPSWHRSGQPFHNGQILDAGGVSWVSVHSLEPRILQLLGTDRLPVDRFGGEEGRRFVGAARRAAAELADLRGRPVHFVHELPAADVTGGQRSAALLELGGGAGIDLDSVLTLLPVDGEGRVAALVGDLDLGRQLVSDATPDELAGLGVYGVSAEAVMPAAALDRFLERVAGHLAGQGLGVRRVPLLQLDPSRSQRVGWRELDPFLITWNNVVLEASDAGKVAEGFASGFGPGDEAARRVYAQAGYELRLLPPLVESIVRNGGFRCASQHVRRFLDTPQGGI